MSSSGKKKTDRSHKRSTRKVITTDVTSAEQPAGEGVQAMESRAGKGNQQRFINRTFVDPDNYVGPELSPYTVESTGYARMRVAFDTRMIVSGMARRILQSSATKWTLNDRALQPDPEYTKTVVKEVRESFKRRVTVSLMEFLDGLLEDLFYESLLALDGELKYPASRDTVKKRWKGNVSARIARIRRTRFAREGVFPNRYLLRNALLEAFAQILSEGHKGKIKQSEVVSFFRNHSNYSSCGDDSTLRYWLRRHGFGKWKRVEESLRREIRL